MGGRIWPGALCVITGGHCVTEAIGMVVTAVLPCEPAGWFVEGHAIKALARRLGVQCSVFERYLTPLLPPPDASTTEDRAPVDAPMVAG